MKKILILLLLAALLYFILPAPGEELETVNKTAFLIASADGNDADLDANQTSWGATAAWPEVTTKANYLKVKFYSYDSAGPNDKTFSYEFYLADYGCNAELVASGSATVGGAQLSHNPVSLAEFNDGDPNSLYLWVDTLGTITSDWATTIYPQNESTSDEPASFLFDRQGGKRAWCRIYNLTSATMTVYCVGYYY